MTYGSDQELPEIVVQGGDEIVSDSDLFNLLDAAASGEDVSARLTPPIPTPPAVGPGDIALVQYPLHTSSGACSFAACTCMKPRHSCISLRVMHTHSACIHLQNGVPSQLLGWT